MTDYIEDSDFGTEYEEIFNDWYEIEGARKIKELSRQLRTFFNYQTEVIRYRFRSNLSPAENDKDSKFFTQKQKMESLSIKFIDLLKNLKKNGFTLEQEIQSLYFRDNKSQINNLLEITEKLFILIHYFSEVSLRAHPRFLKFIVVLVQHLCLVKKCLNVQFSKFFEELEINYNNLEEELEDLIEITPVKNQQLKKQLEERLTS